MYLQSLKEGKGCQGEETVESVAKSNALGRSIRVAAKSLSYWKLVTLWYPVDRVPLELGPWPNRRIQR